jgi:hypothetical protein
MYVSGGRSTVNSSIAGDSSVMPSVLVARTWNVWRPSTRPV